VGVRKSRSVTKRTLLIDADIIAYEFSNRGQRVYEWGDDEASVALDDIGEITPGIEQRFQTWMEDLEADDMIVCLTPSPDDNNFRKKLAPYYKGNRKGIAKPLLHEPVRQWLDSRYRTFMRDGLEADDCMGILSTHPTLVPGEKVIVSGDKDMQTIPGLLFNPNKARLRTIRVASGLPPHAANAHGRSGRQLPRAARHRSCEGREDSRRMPVRRLNVERGGLEAYA
jgi:hypothetical protein